MRKLISILLFVALISNVCIANIDTTNTKGFKNLHDTTQLRILVEYSDECEINEILKYTSRAIEIGKSIFDKNPRFESSQYYAAAYNNEAFYYDQVGKIKEALNFYLKSLKIREEIRDSLGIGESYINIAYLFQQQGDYNTATNYYSKAEKIFTNLGDKKGLVGVYVNWGYVYFLEEKFDSSQRYFELGLKLSKEINDIRGTSYALNNLASIYLKKELYDKTEQAYLESLQLREQIGLKDGIARSHNNLGRFYFKRDKLKKSFYHANISYKLAQELNSPDVIGQVAILLSELYDKQNNFEKAYDFLMIHVEMKDSILSNETQRTMVKQQAKYKYEKQKLIDDAAYEKQIALSAEQEKKQRVIIYSIAIGLALVIIFSILIYKRLQVTRKQKLVIEEQKQEVEQQKEIIEEAHKEITDSITYAKRIQEAILPPDRLVQKWLTNSFIIYKPKDIVAGDFYWMESVKKERYSALDAESPKNKDTANLSEISGQSFDSAQDDIRNDENLVLFAAADCTGHGVPGAMVSVVCHNAMNRAVREFKLINPGEILDKTRELVVEQFKKSDKDVKDGMDIALCVLNNKTNQLQYSGAHNPLWIVRKGEIIVIKADKQPIGKFENIKPFTTHKFDLQKGDSIYIFSDGYVDQFGGENGKKFKTKSFRELLLSIQDKSMEEQKIILINAFEDWRGDLEQVDDVCIIGVRI